MKPDIESRIARYEEGQIEFAILALLRDPITALTDELAQNVKDMMFLSEQADDGLSTLTGEAVDKPSGQMPLDGGGLLGPSERYRLHQEAIDTCRVSLKFKEMAESGSEPSLRNALSQLTADQARLRRSILEEVEAREAEVRRVACRQHDFGPLAQKVAEILAKRDAVDLMKESKSKGAKKRR